MNKNKAIFVFVLAVFLISSANAAQNVTYLCCRNFTPSNGTLLEAFDTTGDWTVSTPANTVAKTDTTHYIEGTQGIELGGSNSAQQPTMTKTVSLDLDNINSFEMWVYVANVSNLSTSAAIGIYFSNDAGFTKYGNVNVLGTELINGWNHLGYNKTELTLVGGMTLSDSVARLRVRHNIIAGTIGNVTYDNLRININSRAKAIIAFDDGNYTVYQNAYPVMSANNQRGISNTVTGSVGATGFMTLTQNTGLYNNGWDISSHTENHSHLTELSQNQISGELNNSYNWLINNGFTKSAGFLAIPYGDYNDTVLDGIKSRYILSRSSVNGDHQPNFGTDNNIGNITYLLKILSVLDTTSNQTVKDAINKTINRSGTIILLYHRVVNAPTTQFSTEVTLSNFTEVSNYLASRNDIDVVTFYDYMRVIAPNNTPIIGKTVNINATLKLSEVVANNPLLGDNTVNMVVRPSSDSVNVTVTSWGTSGDYRKIWTENSINSSATTFHNIGDFPANVPVFIKVDGVITGSTTSNGTGWITYTYSGAFSNHTFESYLTTEERAVLQSNWCNPYASNSYGMLSIGTILTFVVAAVLLFVGIQKQDFKLMIAGVLVIVAVIISILTGILVLSRMLPCG